MLLCLLVISTIDSHFDVPSTLIFSRMVPKNTTCSGKHCCLKSLIKSCLVFLMFGDIHCFLTAFCLPVLFELWSNYTKYQRIFILYGNDDRILSSFLSIYISLHLKTNPQDTQWLVAHRNMDQFSAFWQSKTINIKTDYVHIKWR